jgi:hypothetical protein
VVRRRAMSRAREIREGHRNQELELGERRWWKQVYGQAGVSDTAVGWREDKGVLYAVLGRAGARESVEGPLSSVYQSDGGTSGNASSKVLKGLEASYVSC